MTTLIDEQFAFNLWANTEIIRLCTSLDEAQLAVEIPGTFGRIQPTVAHIVRSEGNYLRDLGGDAPWPTELDWGALSLAQLLEMAQQSGTLLQEQASRIAPDTRCEFVEENERYVFPAWTVINQAINHGIEHRTQIRLLLTELGVPHPGHRTWQWRQDRHGRRPGRQHRRVCPGSQHRLVGNSPLKEQPHARQTAPQRHPRHHR